LRADELRRSRFQVGDVLSLVAEGGPQVESCRLRDCGVVVVTAAAADGWSAAARRSRSRRDRYGHLTIENKFRPVTGGPDLFDQAGVPFPFQNGDGELMGLDTLGFGDQIRFWRTGRRRSTNSAASAPVTSFSM
jgi:hypothetical protein